MSEIHKFLFDGLPLKGAIVVRFENQNFDVSAAP